MGAGRTATKRPLAVPVGEAHSRITENVRRTNAGIHLLGAEDVDQTSRPASGHAMVWDTVSGLWKVALAPPFLKFNRTGTLSVSGSDHDPVGSSGKVILVRGLLTTSGSTTTTAILKQNASTTVATFSFTSGNTTPTSNPTVSVSFVDGDYFWLDVTAAGTGAAGLVVACWATAA